MRLITQYCSTVVITLVIAGSAAYSQDDPLNVGAIDAEIQVMAKVLEESIDNAEIENWKGNSATYLSLYGYQEGLPARSSHIQGRYVPGVGAIFVIPVAFPLQPDAEYADETKDEKSDPTDLWQKHQRSSAQFGFTGQKSSLAVDFSKLYKVISDKGMVIDEVHLKEGEIQVLAGLQKAKKGASGGGGSSGAFVFTTTDNHPILLSGSGTFNAQDYWNLHEEYDEEKVAKLRSTLLNTLAEYGHRMEHLQPNAKVIVIVETAGRGYRSQIPYLSDVPLIGYLFRGSATGTTPYGRSTDHYQIVVRKRDLTNATTVKALEGKIEETEY